MSRHVDALVAPVSAKITLVDAIDAIEWFADPDFEASDMPGFDKLDLKRLRSAVRELSAKLKTPEGKLKP